MLFFQTASAGISTAPGWTASGKQAGAEFGLAVATAGDVNGDGFSDVLVGAPYYDNGQVDEGRVFLYLGTSAGLNTNAEWTAESDRDGALFGYAVACAGDVNGDGYDDVVVGAPLYSNGALNEGAAFLYLGSATGLAPYPSWVRESGHPSEQMGWSVAGAGDVNGDGYGDFLIGGPYGGRDLTGEGLVYAYYGGPYGPSFAPNWLGESNNLNSFYGQAISTAGDVNGDGYDDIVVGAWRFGDGNGGEGKAFVYEGGPNGLHADADWGTQGGQDNASYGFSVSTVGDVNGDGYSDVIVGAERYTSGERNEGRAFVYLGTANGLGFSAAWIAEPNLQDSRFGTWVACAGDVNGDGYGDALIGGWGWHEPEPQEGGAWVYSGSSAGLGADPSWHDESNQTNARYAWQVASAGDVNGDGYSDIIAGAFGYEVDAYQEGAAFLYYGGGNDLVVAPGWTQSGGEAGAGFGTALSAAGDVNGDGFADVLVGAPLSDAGLVDAGRVVLFAGGSSGLSLASTWQMDGTQADERWGAAVSGAGDMNGDGYSDVVIAAPYYDGAAPDAGRVAAYLGSPTGVSSVAAWSAQGTTAGERFGAGLALCGDVNGDGFCDLVVGAPGYSSSTPNCGRVLIYLGAPGGLAGTPARIILGTEPDQQFGETVAYAGDINRDGMSDIVVGAPYSDHSWLDGGQAFLYLGEPGGASGSASWIGDPNQPGALFGASVQGAGDVNGDGFGDVIVGAPGYDDAHADEGRAFLYRGTATGLTPTPGWTTDGGQDSVSYGVSVSRAGDVNGDGFDDVIVGAELYNLGEKNEGRAVAYLGSAAGLAVSSTWSVDADEVGARLGHVVAPVGDVNGDGFGDVAVAANTYGVGLPVEGRVLLFYGNGTDGIDRAQLQVRVDDSAPVSAFGRVPGNSFRIVMTGRTPKGRGPISLEWEVKKVGTAFDGTGLGHGVVTLTGSPSIISGSSTPLDQTVSALALEASYRWRARIVSRDPLFPRSPWTSLAAIGLAETDVRTSDVSDSVHAPGAAPQAARTLSFAGVSPTPARGASTIAYTLARDADVEVTIYSVDGRRVAALMHEAQDAGRHAVTWRPRDAAAGVYRARVRAGGETLTRTIVLVD